MTFDVIKWMAEHGHPGYGVRIAKLEKAMALLRVGDDGDGPILAGFEPLTRAMEAEKEAIRAEAQDRYDDWASDFDYD